MKAPILLALTLLQATAAFGQGLLTPPGAPEPTQRSLQEIWDRLNLTKLQVTKQNEEIYDLNKAISAEITGIQGRLDDAAAEHKAQNTELQTQVTTLLTQGTTLQTQVTTLQTQLSQVRSENQLLFAAASPSLPFIVSSVDSAGYVGTYTSLAFGPDGQPAISYSGGTNVDLKFARFNGSIWTTSFVDSAGAVGNQTSLAFGPDGRAAISYFDQDKGDLKIARQGVFKPSR